jgi:DNA replication protein DnaC
MSGKAERFVVNGREGKRYETTGEGDDEVIVETPEYARVRAARELHERYALANVDEPDRDYFGSDKKENMPKIRTYVERFSQKYKHINLYLWSGLNGTQKSTVARWICRRLIDQGFTAHFILMGTLTKTLTRRGFPDADDWLLDTVMNVDFLVIDDAFDPKKVTLYKSGYQLPFLDEFLRQRIEMDRKAICFTSNVEVGMIEESFGPSLRSLVKRSVPYPMEMKDAIDSFEVEDLWK